VPTTLKITKRSHPHDAAGRIVRALSSGDETAVCTGYGRRHHLPNDGAGGVDSVLQKINVLVRAELPEVRSNYFRRPNGERVWIWSFGDAVPGHAYFPQGELGGDAYWVPDGSGRLPV